MCVYISIKTIYIYYTMFIEIIRKDLGNTTDKARTDYSISWNHIFEYIL